MVLGYPTTTKAATPSTTKAMCVSSHEANLSSSECLFLQKVHEMYQVSGSIDYDLSIMINIRLAILAQIVTSEINAFMRTYPKADKKATKSIAKKRSSITFCS